MGNARLPFYEFFLLKSIVKKRKRDAENVGIFTVFSAYLACKEGIGIFLRADPAAGLAALWWKKWSKFPPKQKDYLMRIRLWQATAAAFLHLFMAGGPPPAMPSSRG
jgi:hypothetical protein